MLQFPARLALISSGLMPPSGCHSRGWSHFLCSLVYQQGGRDYKEDHFEFTQVELICVDLLCLVEQEP